MQRLMAFLALIALLLIAAPAIAQDGDSRPPITVENAPQIEQVGILGRGFIYEIAWSPDGSLFAVNSSLGVWLCDGEHLDSEPRLFPTLATSMALSWDGTKLATGSVEGAITLWDVGTGEILNVFEGQAGRTRGMAFSPDDSLLASGSFGGPVLEPEGDVHVWDIESGALLHVLETGAVRDLAFQPDSALLVVLSYGQGVQFWDARMAEQISAPDIKIGGSAGGEDLAFNADRTMIVHVFWGGFKVWNLSSGEEIPFDQDELLLDRAQSSAAFSADGATLAIGDANGNIRGWNVTSGKIQTGFRQETDVIDLAAHPHRPILASAGFDGVIHFWDLNTRRTYAEVQGFVSWINTLAFSPHGTTLVAANVDNTWQWEVATGAFLGVGQGYKYFAGSGTNPYNNCVTYSPNSNLLATGTVQDGVVRLWRPSSERRGTLETARGRDVYTVAFNQDGTMLAASLGDLIFLWETRMGQALTGLRVRDNFAQSLAFNPDGTILAVGTYTGPIYLRDVQNESRQVLITLRGHDAPVNGLAFNPDGMLLASGSGDWENKRTDNSVRLWNTITGEEVAVLQGHTEFVSRVIFSPDGEILASASKDGTVRLWDVETGRNLAVIETNTGWDGSIAFNPGGTLLASGSWGTIYLWGIPTLE